MVSRVAVDVSCEMPSQTKFETGHSQSNRPLIKSAVKVVGISRSLLDHCRASRRSKSRFLDLGTEICAPGPCSPELF